MNSLVKRSILRHVQRNSQRRPFLFVIVPIIGVAAAVMIGGAITIYGMEMYRKYQLKKEKDLLDVNKTESITKTHMKETSEEASVGPEIPAKSQIKEHS
jgi:ABC-type lipoprotein release transport system permease subunit